MSWPRRQIAAAQRGNAAVEFALLLPILVLIVCGAVDFSRILHAYVTVASTAHEAARYAARFPGAQVAPAAMQTAVASESQGFVKLGVASGGNASIVGPSIEGVDEQVAKVTLTYQFDPVSPIPLAGPIPINVSASAPTGGAGGVPTSTPIATPTATRTPTVTPSPSPTATPCTRTAPSLVGLNYNGSQAQSAWNASGLTGSVTGGSGGGGGNIVSQSVPAGSSVACSASVTVYK